MKDYYQQNNIGRAKYTISFHDGKKTHDDGSAFYDIRTFKTLKTLHAFIDKLESTGYTAR